MTRIDHRSAGLDALRAIASFMVVAFHLRTIVKVDFGPLNPFVEGGGAGVWIFFALSGYLLYRPFVAGPVDLRAYALKRAARILPGYYVALVALTALTGNRLPIEHPLPYLAMFASYELPLRGFLGVAWTLAAEVLFYVSLPALAWLARGREVAVLGALGIGSLSLALSHPADVADPNIWVTGTFPFVFYAFVPGMLLAFAEARRSSILERLRRPTFLSLGIAYVLIGVLVGTLPGAIVPGAALVGLSTPMIMAWTLGRRVPAPRLLAFLGGASYAMYLWHWDAFNAFGIVGLPIAMAGAALSWSLVERPILDRARRLASTLTIRAFDWNVVLRALPASKSLRRP
ncbi:MAG TPA: acyltransferase [Candidatus Dormibacteraeota bacterium]|nr:acyltransferase [Candidatus Dormibacteraeota bacterium]